MVLMKFKFPKVGDIVFCRRKEFRHKEIHVTKVNVEKNFVYGKVDGKGHERRFDVSEILKKVDNT